MLNELDNNYLRPNISHGREHFNCLFKKITVGCGLELAYVFTLPLYHSFYLSPSTSIIASSSFVSSMVTEP